MNVVTYFSLKQKLNIKIALSSFARTLKDKVENNFHHCPIEPRIVTLNCLQNIELMSWIKTH